MIEEILNISRTYRIESPTKDGLEKVQERFPYAIAEGSVGHYTYYSPEAKVAEAWQANKYWYLRILS